MEVTIVQVHIWNIDVVMFDKILHLSLSHLGYSTSSNSNSNLRQKDDIRPLFDAFLSVAGWVLSAWIGRETKKSDSIQLLTVPLRHWINASSEAHHGKPGSSWIVLVILLDDSHGFSDSLSHSVQQSAGSKAIRWDHDCSWLLRVTEVDLWPGSLKKHYARIPTYDNEFRRIVKSNQSNTTETSNKTWDIELTHMIETMAKATCSKLTYLTRWVYRREK